MIKLEHIRDQKCFAPNKVRAIDIQNDDTKDRFECRIFTDIK